MAAVAAPTTTKEHVLRQLARTDAGNTGVIQRSELSHVFRRLGPNWTEDKIEALMDIMDIKDKGYIRYHDFVDWVFSEGENQNGPEGATLSAPGEKAPEQLPSRPQSATQAAIRLRLRKVAYGDEAGASHAAGGAVGAIRFVSKDGRSPNLRSTSSPTLLREPDLADANSGGQEQSLQVGTPPVQTQLYPRRASSAGRRSAGRKRTDHSVTFSSSALEAKEATTSAPLSSETSVAPRPPRRAFVRRDEVERVCKGLQTGVEELQQHALRASEEQEARLAVKDQCSQTAAESAALGVSQPPTDSVIGEDAETADKSRYGLLSQLVAARREAESAGLRASATDELMEQLHLELRRRQEEADVFAARDFQPSGANQDPETERLPGGDHSTSLEASGYPLLNRLGTLCSSWQDCAAQFRATARVAEERAAKSAFDAALAQRSVVTAEEAVQAARAAEAVSTDLAAAARAAQEEQAQELARLRSEVQELEEQEHLRREVLTESACEAAAESARDSAPEPEAGGRSSSEGDVYFGEVLNPEHGLAATLDRLRHLLGGLHGKAPSSTVPCTSMGELAEALGDLEDGAALMRGQLLAAQSEVQNLACTCLQLRMQLANATSDAAAASARLRESSTEQAAVWASERRELKSELHRAKKELRGAVQANQLAQSNLNVSRSSEARATAEMQLLRAELDRLEDGRSQQRQSHMDISSGGVSGATLTYSSEHHTDPTKQPLSHSVLQVTNGGNGVVLSAFTPKAAKSSRAPKEAAWAKERSELRSELAAARQDAAWAKERCEVQEELARTRSDLASVALAAKDGKRSKKSFHSASGSGSEATTPTDTRASLSQSRRHHESSRQQLPPTILAGLNDSGTTPHWGNDISLEFQQVASWMREKSELQSELARARQDLGGTVQAAIATRECLNDTRASEALAHSELRAMRIEMERLTAAVGGGSSPQHPFDLSAIPLSGTMPQPPQIDVGAAAAISILSGSEESEAGSAPGVAQSGLAYTSSAGRSTETTQTTFKANIPGGVAVVASNGARPAILAADPKHKQAPPAGLLRSPANEVLNQLPAGCGTSPSVAYLRHTDHVAVRRSVNVSASSHSRSQLRKHLSRSQSDTQAVRSPAGGGSAESSLLESRGSRTSMEDVDA